MKQLEQIRIDSDQEDLMQDLAKRFPFGAHFIKGYQNSRPLTSFDITMPSDDPRLIAIRKYLEKNLGYKPNRNPKDLSK